MYDVVVYSTREKYREGGNKTNNNVRKGLQQKYRRERECPTFWRKKRWTGAHAPGDGRQAGR